MSARFRFAARALTVSTVALTGCGQKTPERPPYADQSCEDNECEVVGRPGAPDTPPPTPVGDAGAIPTPPPTPDPDTSSPDPDTTVEEDSGLGAGSVAFDPQEATDLERTSGQAI